MPHVLYSEIENIDDEIKHYGVKGMRWGVQKAATRLAGGTVPKDQSPEAAAAKAIAKKARIKGKASLTNAELKAFNDRLNLEQNYERLKAGNKSEGRKFVENLVKDHGLTIAKMVATQVKAKRAAQ